MAKAAALMLVAMFVMSALLSSSAASGVEYGALAGNSKSDAPANGAERACQTAHQCRSKRKLLGESEMSISVAVEATEKEAEDLKTKFMSLFQ